MKDLLDKITSYNLFNYLLPGVIFAVALSKYTRFSLLQENLVVGAFVYYFIGLVISRVGSLVIEPLLKKLSFVRFADYWEFVEAARKDPRIETLSEANNMYRTLCATFLLLGLARLYQWLHPRLGVGDEKTGHVIVVLLLLMFLYSYRKQTAYITKRVKANVDRP